MFDHSPKPLMRLASGHPFSLPTFTARGAGDGPSVYIQANVHGSENQGAATIYQLMRLLEREPAGSLRGDLTLVPCANPYGLNSKVAEHTVGPFSLTSGENWNRAYVELACRGEQARGHEAQVDAAAFAKASQGLAWPELRAAYKQRLREALRRIVATRRADGRVKLIHLHSHAIQEMAMAADLVLDLHTSARGCRFVYAPEYALDAAASLHVDFAVAMTGRFEGALDEAFYTPWARLLEALRDLGRDIPGNPPDGMKVSPLTARSAR